MAKEIVYTAENGDEYTKEMILSDINLWMEEQEDFRHLTYTEKKAIEQVTYDVLLSLLDWTAPYTKLAEFEEEDVDELFERANVHNPKHRNGSSLTIKGLIDGKAYVIATKRKQSGPPHELFIDACQGEGIHDIRTVGLQYYDFSMFSMLLEVYLNESEWKHFIIHSWEFENDDPILEPLQVENPYLYFNEIVKENLIFIC